MAYTKRVSKQLEEFIAIPTVLVTKEDVPYEFKDTGSAKRFRCRRYLKEGQEIPFELYGLVIEEGVHIVKLLEFSSGIFLNYVNQKGIYL